ncbi:MAG: transglycosylase SLT domain-containing protein [Deltaproteobacteria bacterium]|nr:transglycosylase SLT domain-containing protein [Deltaproteobacteria bacterium]
MSGDKQKKITTVHAHPRHVPVSKKNPSGITIVDQHLRRLPGTYLDAEEIEKIFKTYDKTRLTCPTLNNLDYKNGNQYDEIIAFWTDYFNGKFNVDPKIHPNVIKALIASESGFDANPRGNKKAFGITQITKQTLRILQDPNGEAKDFIFNKIRLKDLKNPNIAIPMAVRWLFKKREMATRKLGRTPTDEEMILEYKGMLKSNSRLKKNALINFRKHYENLKKK